ncbi:MAG: S-layer homology domain-containing protein [Clostridia bacterium]|nr:S-layer homology domain-containing protein [Clostridia bacterium]
MKKFSIVCLTVFLCHVYLFALTGFAQTLVASDFSKSTPKNTALSFRAEDFIANANPPAGKNLNSVRFNQLPNSAAGKLLIDGAAAVNGKTYDVDALNRLVFVPTAEYEGEAIFTWTAIYKGAQSPYPGAVVIVIGAGDNTPSILDPEDNNVNIGEQPSITPEGTTPPDKTEGNSQTHQVEKEENHNSASQQPNSTNTGNAQTNTLKPLRYEDMLSHWGAYSAGMLASRGYIIGEDYGNRFYFHPDETINRFEFILMVNAVFGVQPKDSLADNPFSDKNVPDYVMRAGIAAYEYQIISGNKEKNGKLYFRPYSAITRAEAITILDYALQLDTYGVPDMTFKDRKSVPEWAVQSVRNLEAYGVLQGYEDNTIRPNENITRAQAAEMVWQVLKFLDLKRNTNAVFSTIIYGD